MPFTPSRMQRLKKIISIIFVIPLVAVVIVIVATILPACIQAHSHPVLDKPVINKNVAVLEAYGKSYELTGPRPIYRKKGWDVLQVADNMLFYIDRYDSFFHEKGRRPPMDTLFIPENQQWHLGIDDWSMIDMAGGSIIGIVPKSKTDSGIPHIYIEKGDIIPHLCRKVEISADSCTIENSIDPDYSDTSVLEISFDGLKKMTVSSLRGKVRIDNGKHLSFITPGTGYLMPPSTDSVAEYFSSEVYNEYLGHTFVIKGKTIAEILKEFVSYYGVVGYKFAPEVDSTEVGLFGSLNIKTDLPLPSLLYILSVDHQVYLKAENGIIFFSKKPFEHPTPLKVTHIQK